jgi:hypothetical protein
MAQDQKSQQCDCKKRGLVEVAHETTSVGASGHPSEIKVFLHTETSSLNELSRMR